MENTTYVLLSELPGLCAVQQIIRDKIEELHGLVSGPRAPGRAPRKKRASPARLAALAKARAAKAQKLKQAAAGNKKGKVGAMKAGRKQRGSWKRTAVKAGSAAAA